LAGVVVSAVKQWGESWIHSVKTHVEEAELAAEVMKLAWKHLSSFGEVGCGEQGGDISDLLQQLTMKCLTSLMGAVASSVSGSMGEIRVASCLMQLVGQSIEGLGGKKYDQQWSFSAVFALVSLRTILQTVPLQYLATLISLSQSQDQTLSSTVLKTFFSSNLLDDALKRLALEVLTHLPVKDTLVAISVCRRSDQPWWEKAFDQGSDVASLTRVYVFCMSTYLARVGLQRRSEEFQGTHELHVVIEEATLNLIPGLMNIRERILRNPALEESNPKWRTPASKRWHCCQCLVWMVGWCQMLLSSRHLILLPLHRLRCNHCNQRFQMSKAPNHQRLNKLWSSRQKAKRHVTLATVLKRKKTRKRSYSPSESCKRQ